MRRHHPRPLSQLPRLRETWSIGIIQLRIWITPPDERAHRPYMIMVFNGEEGTIRGSELARTPQPQDIRQALLKAMRQPVPGGGKPGVPQTIRVPDSKLAETVAAICAELRLEIDIYEHPLPAGFTEIVREMEEHLRGGPDQPAMLSVRGVTAEMVGDFFQAAAEFYRATPWVKLNNYQVIAIRHPAEKDYRYTIVMGQGGVEYGLATYHHWKDVAQLYTSDENPMERLPDTGAHSLSFDPAHMLPFDDLEAIEKNGWQVAGENAYPVAAIFEKPERVRRPEPMDYQWYQAALRAIPILLRDHLKPDGRGDYLPLETTLTVPTHAGAIAVAVKYPAGHVPIGEQPAQQVDWADFAEDDEEEEMPPAFDRRAMESALHRELRKRGLVDQESSELDRAQEMMYRAWEETNPAKRLALAHDALVISGDCADAYVLLAEEEADTVSRALEYYRQGVEAGERALGQEFFRENAGHFWGLLETRPYMRARRGLADALCRLGRQEDALEHYREMLRLNPNDNQGNRYVMLDLLLQLEREEDARQLLRQYRDEWSAVWLYTRALLAFRASGASAKANAVLHKALKENPHVPAYLTERKRIPNRLPDLIGWGDEREAISYCADHLNYWRRTPGAVAWLEEQRKVKPPQKAEKRKKKKGFFGL